MKKESSTLSANARRVRKFSYQLAWLASVFDKQSTRMLRPFGLSVVDWRIIGRLHDGGPCAMVRLLPAAIVDQALISRRVALLTQRGLIATSVDPNDGRQKLISLSRKGEALYKQIMPLSDARQAALEEALSGAEVVAFYDVVTKLRLCIENDLVGDGVSPEDEAVAPPRNTRVQKGRAASMQKTKREERSNAKYARSS